MYQTVIWGNVDLSLIEPYGIQNSEIEIRISELSLNREIRLQNGGRFVSVSMCQVKRQHDRLE